MKIKGLITIVFILLTESAGADSGSTDKSCRMLLFFEMKEDSSSDSVNRVLLYESLLIQLNDIGSELVILESPDSLIPSTHEDKSRLAGALGANAWLTVIVSAGPRQVGYKARSFDLVTQTLVFDEEFARESLEPRDLETIFWYDLVKLIQEKYRIKAALPAETDFVIPDTSPAYRIGLAKIIFRGQPGTIITGLNRKKIELDKDGVATIEVPYPATYSFQARCTGYETVEDSFVLTGESWEIRLNQLQAARMALDFFLYTANFPGVEFSYYLVPDTLFLRGGFTFFWWGIFFLDEDEFNYDGSDAQAPFIISLNLMHFDVTLGYYLNANDNVFRFYPFIGVFVRFMFVSGNPFFPEPIAPFGIKSGLGLEINLGKNFALYFEQAVLLHLSADPEYLQRNVKGGTEQRTLQFTPFGVFDFFNVRLGCRWKFS